MAGGLLAGRFLGPRLFEDARDVLAQRGEDVNTYFRQAIGLFAFFALASRPPRSLSPLPGALPLVMRQQALAQADGLRRHLDQLVVVDEVQRLLQAQLHRRRQAHGNV